MLSGVALSDWTVTAGLDVGAVGLGFEVPAGVASSHAPATRVADTTAAKIRGRYLMMLSFAELNCTGNES
jgi:hypothetical protein